MAAATAVRMVPERVTAPTRHPGLDGIEQSRDRSKLVGHRSFGKVVEGAGRSV